MNKQELVTVARSQVPAYLQASELFKSFEGDEDDEITVPSDYFKRDLDIIYMSDLEHLLRTVKFWILRPYPDELMQMLLDEFCLEVDDMLGNQDCDKSLQLFLRQVHQHRAEYRIRLSAQYGLVDFLDYFVRHGAKLSTLYFHDAARNGHLSCLKYIFFRLKPEEQRNCATPKLWKNMIRFGHASCIAFLLSQKELMLPDYIKREDVSAITYATRCNQVECLKVLFAYATRSQHSGTSFCAPLITWTAAMATKDSPCFNFLISVCAAQVQSNCSLLRLSCKAGNVAAMRVLYEEGCPMPVDIVHQAALGGCLSCLQYLQNNLGMNCWVPSTMVAAAGAGKVQLVKRLHEQGCPWDESAIMSALSHNRPEILDFLLRQRGVPKSAKFSLAAAHSGAQCQFMVLQFQMYSMVKQTPPEIW